MSKNNRKFFRLSPKLIGVSNYVMTTETIRSLLNNSPIVSFNLCFFKLRNKLPRFGLSTVSIKTLLALTGGKNDIEKLPVVKEHFWSEIDYKIWHEKFCDNNYAVHITFRVHQNKVNDIDIIFSHENVNSSIYSYKLNDCENDAYFIIFVPNFEIVQFFLYCFDKITNYIFVENLIGESGRISFLSNYEYLSLLSNKIIEKRFSKKFVPTECVSCYSNLAEIVFLPCGHISFCRKCVTEYQESTCPICKQDSTNKVYRIMAANFCLMCSPKYNCKEVNAMIIPCYCVVGCIKTTLKLVEPGEKCPNCEKIVENIQQIYY